MKRLFFLLACFLVMQPMWCRSGNNRSDTQKKDQSSRGSLSDLRCDSEGYYFDRGGRRMFETSYDSYEKGTFNLRRGHLWSDQSCKKHRCHRAGTSKRSQCSVTQPDSEQKNVRHEHYSAEKGITRWPSAPGPDGGKTGTSAFPYVATPIWFRDTSGASGYATPTSWQGFQ